MRIAVTVKQVPETGDVKMDEVTGTLVREGCESIMNPLDLHAVEAALVLTQNHGGEITVISMGPPDAERALREALSMGCHQALLITGRAFAGSDTWATALALSHALRQCGPFDLILCGEKATDGETGQVGPELAALLDVPLVTYVGRIVEVQKGKIIASRYLEDGCEKIEADLPALLTVVRAVNSPRLPTLRGKKAARSAGISHLDESQLGLDPERIGLRGSPTRVEKIYRPQITRTSRIVHATDEKKAQDAVEEYITFLREKGVLR